MLIASVDAGVQILEHQAQQAADFVWRDGFGFDGQGGTLAQLGQFLGQCYPLGFRLADAAFIGIDQRFVRVGHQVNQFPDFIVDTGQLLFHAGDLAAVYGVIDQCLHGRGYTAHHCI